MRKTPVPFDPADFTRLLDGMTPSGLTCTRYWRCSPEFFDEIIGFAAALAAEGIEYEEAAPGSADPWHPAMDDDIVFEFGLVHPDGYHDRVCWRHANPEVVAE